MFPLYRPMRVLVTLFYLGLQIKISNQGLKEKPSKSPGVTHTGKELIKNTCKNCGEEFDTYNPKKETCSDKCRAAFFRRKR